LVWRRDLLCPGLWSIRTDGSPVSLLARRVCLANAIWQIQLAP